MIHRSAVSTAPLFGAQNVRFDPTKFGWIGNMNNDLSVCVIWQGAAAKNFEDLKTKPSIFGGVGAYAGAAIFDATGGYEAAFIVMFVSSVIAFLLALTMRKPHGAVAAT